MNRQSGSSIVQVLMVTFFVATAGLNMANAIKNQTKQVKQWAQKATLRDLESSVRAVVEDAPSCESNLDSVTNPALTFDRTAATPTMTLPRILSGAVPTSHVIAQAGQEVSASGVIVDTIQLVELLDTGANIWTAKWQINFQTTVEDSFSFAPIIIGPQSFRVDATNPTSVTITNCVATVGNPWFTGGNAPNPVTATYANYYIGTTTNVDIVIRRNNNLVGLLNRSNNRTQLGADSIPELATGTDLTALGFGALGSNTDGAENVAVGDGALMSNTTGIRNTAAGYRALRQNVSGDNNTAIGSLALGFGTALSELTAVGSSALSSNTTGLNNSAVGAGALARNTTGSRNLAMGYLALNNAGVANDNIAIGRYNLYRAVDGGNVSVGTNTFGGISTVASNNVALGAGINYNGNYPNTVGSNNTFVGAESHARNYESHFSVGFGWASLQSSSQDDNVAIGRLAGAGGASEFSVAIGSDALWGGTNYMTAVGFNACRAGCNGFNNSTSIGANSSVTASNMVRLGDGAVTIITGAGAYFNMSDLRLKENISPYEHGLDLILNLRPVTYSLKSDTGKSIHSGFIAQEVEETGVPFYGLNKPGNKDGFYSIAYAEFVVPLVNAVKELYSELVNLKSQIDSQSERLEQLQDLLLEQPRPEEVKVE